MQKDERIQQLSTALREVQRCKNEESNTVEEEKCRLKELQSHLNNQEASLNLARQTLEEEKQQLEEEIIKFRADEKDKYDKSLIIEKKKTESELQRKVRQNEKAVAAKLEQATHQIQQLKGQVSDLTVAEDDVESTLALFKSHTRELEGSRAQVQDSGYPIIRVVSRLLYSFLNMDC
jgi:chromosome segregation ATPase